MALPWIVILAALSLKDGKVLVMGVDGTGTADFSLAPAR